MKKNQPQLTDADIAEMKALQPPEKVIDEKENEEFKAAFGTDHPDYKDPDLLDVGDIIEPETNVPQTTLSDQEIEDIRYDGKTKEEWWASKHREYPKNNLKAGERFKELIAQHKNPNLIHNQVLGYVLPQVEREALERGAITKKIVYDLVYYSIPSEVIEVMEKGKSRKVVVASSKYTNFIQELKSGNLKINKSTLL